MTIAQTRWIVVEQAGYVGEQDVHTATNIDAAFAWMNATYTFEEIDDLHVDVCLEDANGERSYEH